jgi:hypothetical protein
MYEKDPANIMGSISLYLYVCGWFVMPHVVIRTAFQLGSKSCPFEEQARCIEIRMLQVVTNSPS